MSKTALRGRTEDSQRRTLERHVHWHDDCEWRSPRCGFEVIACANHPIAFTEKRVTKIFDRLVWHQWQLPCHSVRVQTINWQPSKKLPRAKLKLKFLNNFSPSAEYCGMKETKTVTKRVTASDSKMKQLLPLPPNGLPQIPNWIHTPIQTTTRIFQSKQSLS